MVLARYGDAVTPEDAGLLGESITMPFSGKIAKSRFFKAGKLHCSNCYHLS